MPDVPQKPHAEGRAVVGGVAVRLPGEVGLGVVGNDSTVALAREGLQDRLPVCSRASGRR
ncbi:MAG: hypothetical protein V9G29_05030 [Burkholderiaceae bacterium]